MDLLFVIFVFYGPKIYFLDTSILVPLILLIYKAVAKKNNPKINMCSISVLFFIFILIIYQLILALFVSSNELIPILRNIRAFISVFLISSYVSLAFFDISKALLKACILHSIILIFFTFTPELSGVVNDFLGYKDTRFLRSTGLVAGYDMAGLIALTGLLILAFDDALKKTYFLFALILLAACLFSSRLTMVIGGLIFIYMALKITKVNNLGFFSKVVLFSISLPISSLVIFVAFNAVLFSFGYDSFFEKESFERVYAAGTADRLETMYFLPKDENELIFGLGIKPESDVGYVREIYKYGIVGLFFVIITYIFILITTLKSFEMAKKTALTVLFLLFLIFILSFKNNYFLTRVSLPSLWLLYSSITYYYLNNRYKVNFK
jgi:hypothetical protein